MKLAQLHEARYAGDHPIVKEIKANIANGEYSFGVNIDDSKKAEDAERGILAAFGPPDSQGPATEDEYRNMEWDLSSSTHEEDWGLTLQIVWSPLYKKIAVRRGQTAPTPQMRNNTLAHKKIAVRRGQTAPTPQMRMEISLI